MIAHRRLDRLETKLRGDTRPVIVWFDNPPTPEQIAERDAMVREGRKVFVVSWRGPDNKERT